MCDLCDKKGTVTTKLPYRSEYYDSLVAVRVCNDCLTKIKKSGDINEYINKCMKKKRTKSKKSYKG